MSTVSLCFDFRNLGPFQLPHVCKSRLGTRCFGQNIKLRFVYVSYLPTEHFPFKDYCPTEYSQTETALLKMLGQDIIRLAPCHISRDLEVIIKLVKNLKDGHAFAMLSDDAQLVKKANTACQWFLSFNMCFKCEDGSYASKTYTGQHALRIEFERVCKKKEANQPCGPKECKILKNYWWMLDPEQKSVIDEILFSYASELNKHLGPLSLPKAVTSSPAPSAKVVAADGEPSEDEAESNAESDSIDDLAMCLETIMEDEAASFDQGDIASTLKAAESNVSPPTPLIVPPNVSPPSPPFEDMAGLDYLRSPGSPVSFAPTQTPVKPPTPPTEITYSDIKQVIPATRKPRGIKKEQVEEEPSVQPCESSTQQKAQTEKAPPKPLLEPELLPSKKGKRKGPKDVGALALTKQKRLLLKTRFT